MDGLRLAFYSAGLVLALVVTYEFARIPHRLARLIAVVFGIWAVNCGVHLALLALRCAQGTSGDVGQWTFTVNAALLVFGPAFALAWLSRERRNGR